MRNDVKNDEPNFVKQNINQEIRIKLKFTINIKTSYESDYMFWPIVCNILKN